MRAFDALARTGSLTGAARELAVTPSAVSQLVASLERRLGLQLAERRSGAKMRLTEAGRRYARALHVAFRHMVKATERLEREQLASPPLAFAVAAHR